MGAVADEERLWVTGLAIDVDALEVVLRVAAAPGPPVGLGEFLDSAVDEFFFVRGEDFLGIFFFEWPIHRAQGSIFDGSGIHELAITEFIAGIDVIGT